jgi:uncharacterized membrane protein YeiH
MTRDVLCGLPADAVGNGRVLHSNADLYASSAVAASLTYLTAASLALPFQVRIALGVLAGFTTRSMATEHEIGMPTWTEPGK